MLSRYCFFFFSFFLFQIFSLNICVASLQLTDPKGAKFLSVNIDYTILCYIILLSFWDSLKLFLWFNVATFTREFYIILMVSFSNISSFSKFNLLTFLTVLFQFVFNCTSKLILLCWDILLLVFSGWIKLFVIKCCCVIIMTLRWCAVCYVLISL